MNRTQLKILLISFFFTFIISNCKNNEKQNSTEIIQIKADNAKQIPLKIKTNDTDFVTDIILESGVINFRIHYLKNKELSYLKLNKSDDYIPVGFCINTSSMEDVINDIKLFQKDSFYYLMIPTCTEELPMFHLVQFDNSSNYKDLGIHAFKYDEQILTLGNFNNFQYDLIEKNGTVSVTGVLSKKRFDLLYNKKFDSESQITNEDLNVINKLDFKKQGNLNKQLNFNGTWGVNCNNELTELNIDGEKGYLSLYDFNSIYINLDVVKSSVNDEYLLKFNSTSSQKKFYSDKLSIVDEEISKDKIIGKLKISYDSKVELNWIGLYNLKLKKLEFVDEDFFND